MRFLFKLFVPLTLLLLMTLSLLLLEERQTFDIRTLVHIDPISHTEQLIKEKQYVDADEYLSYFMDYPYVKENPKSQELLQEIESKRNSYSYQADKFLEGIIQGKSDEDIGKASAIASDFLIIGDIRDLALQGEHYFNHEKVDKVVLALSSLGLIATASTVYSLGTTTPIKTSISILKYGKRVNKLPSWLSIKLVKQAKIAKETRSLEQIKTLFQPISKLYEKVGLQQTLNLLKKTKNFKELKNIVSFSSRFGKKSQILLQTTHNKALNYAKAMPHVQSKNFIYASTYGEKGLKGMQKLGEKQFMKRMRFQANLLKTTYKGNFNSLFNYLLNNIPTSVLYGVVFFGLFYFIRKFLMVAKIVLPLHLLIK